MNAKSPTNMASYYFQYYSTHILHTKCIDIDTKIHPKVVKTAKNSAIFDYKDYADKKTYFQNKYRT